MAGVGAHLPPAPAVQFDRMMIADHLGMRDDHISFHPLTP